MWVLMATLPREKESGKSCLRATATQIPWWVEINDMDSNGGHQVTSFLSNLESTHLTSYLHHTKRCLILQMNMLMRLKEAATSSSPQSYDSDSNSNSHQDDILDSSLESTLWWHKNRAQVLFFSHSKLFRLWELVWFHATKSSHLNFGCR